MALVRADSLAKANGPGRIRGTATELWRKVIADPLRAGSTLRRGLREGRHLHSWERRLVSDGLYGLLRHHVRLTDQLGTDDPDALWTGWLVLQGLESDLHIGETDLATYAGLDETVVAELVEHYGEQGARAFVDASNERASVVLRVNPKRASRDEVLEQIAGEAVDSVAIVAEGRPNLAGSRAYRDGWFEVQDLGSQRVGDFVPGGEVVLDYCAGAGGKSLQLATRDDIGRVLAWDVRKSALDELRKRAKRAGTPVTIGREPADVVLVDAPCSGIGVLRRHPENRFRTAPTTLQSEILAEAAEYVKPGGTLVYATCSVLPSENEAIVATLDGWQIDATLRLAPHTDGTDGFTAFRMTRS